MGRSAHKDRDYGLPRDGRAWGRSPGRGGEAARHVGLGWAALIEGRPAQVPRYSGLTDAHTPRPSRPYRRRRRPGAWRAPTPAAARARCRRCGRSSPTSASGATTPCATSPPASTACQLDDLRVPPGDVAAALATLPPGFREALEVARDQIMAYHRTQVRRGARHERDGIVVRDLVAPGRPGRVLRARRPGPLPVDRAHDAPSRPGWPACRRSCCACRPAADGARRRRDAGRRRPGRRRRGLPGRRGPGHRRHGLRHRVDPAGRRDRRPGQRLRRRGQAPGGRASSACRRPSPARPRSWSSPTRRRRADSPPSTWWSRPSTAPTALAWLVTWARPWPTRVAEVVDRLVADVAPAGRPRGHAARPAATSCSSTGPSRPWRWPTSIAPEHLELMIADADGAACRWCATPAPCSSGRGRPASVGDYMAGPNHVLPTDRHRPASPSALRVDDFRKHIHVVTARRAAPCAGSAPHVVDAGRDRGAGRPRRVGPPPRWPGRERPMARFPPVRDRSRRSGEGYHSPQVDVEVRLNTNESPVPAARGVVRRAAGRARPSVACHRYPDRAATELRQAIADLHGVAPEQVFCANGSNEVLQTLLLAYGGPGRTRRGVRADLRAAPPHRPAHRHRRWPTASATTTSPSTSPRCAGVLDAHAARHHLPVLAQQPDRAWPSPPSRRRAVLDRRAGPGRGRRGLRPVRAAGRRSTLRRRRRAAGRDPHLLQDLVDGRRAPRATWSADPAVVAEPARRWSLPYHLDAPDPAGRPARPALRATRWRPGWPLIAEERGRVAAALADLPVETLAVGRQLHPVPAARPRRRRGVAGAARPLGADPQLRRAGPGLDGCLRVTIGTPEENDRFLAALKRESCA